MNQGTMTVRWVDHGQLSEAELDYWDFDVPGLVVTSGLKRNEPTWWVTHRASGTAVGYGFDSPEPAAAALHDLAAVGIDWCQPGHCLADLARRDRHLANQVVEITIARGGTRRTRNPDSSEAPS